MVSLIHYLVVQRFIPAEFGVDPEKVHFPDPAGNFYIRKAHNRHVIKKEGIPHTFVSCNYFAGFLLPQLAQPDLKAPPRDNIMIFGDGNRKAVFVKEEDVATFTIKAVDDPRTLNKVMYMRPPGNMYSLNELVELWEKKVGKSLEKFYIPEEQVLQSIQAAENPFPNNLFMLFVYSTFVRGDHTNFEIIPSDVESTQLYPDVKYTTIDEYLDGLLYVFILKLFSFICIHMNIKTATLINFVTIILGCLVLLCCVSKNIWVLFSLLSAFRILDYVKGRII
ncbi:isoflavone reductase-like protein [Amborella trichopoda]|uniref:isoflavone reductase-like protein n=1 Tax=Amborella trichopoda TaxID=13333 RepID=UPI0009BE93FE|nr:isoflavone reductase-like protein [Amborella trichopoda]|eukprot:XP_020523143.1 isoflavone reductase-like protein [Amborella trichopoda]